MKFFTTDSFSHLPPIWPFSHLQSGSVPLPRPRDYELRPESTCLPPGETRILSPPGDGCWLKGRARPGE